MREYEGGTRGRKCHASRSYNYLLSSLINSQKLNATSRKRRIPIFQCSYKDKTVQSNSDSLARATTPLQSQVNQYDSVEITRRCSERPGLGSTDLPRVQSWEGLESPFLDYRLLIGQLAEGSSDTSLCRDNTCKLALYKNKWLCRYCRRKAYIHWKSNRSGTEVMRKTALGDLYFADNLYGDHPIFLTSVTNSQEVSSSAQVIATSVTNGQ